MRRSTRLLFPDRPAGYRVGIGSPDDRSLIDAAQAGDHRALEALLRRHHERIYAICRRLAGNDADAADASQEALMAIVRGLPRFDHRSAFSTWAYRVTTNACLDELRRRSRRPVTGLDAEVADAGRLVDDRPDLDDTIADRLDLDAALLTLAPEFRAAIVLRDQLGLDYAEIAEVLDIPPGTVRSRIARGRAALARHLEADPGNPDPLFTRPSSER